MKTPDEILYQYFYSFKDGHKERMIDAMKEYAKQWVHEAQRTSVAVTGVDDVPFVAGKSFEDLIKAIEKD